ncbi:MAG: hypothetical protein M0Z56_03665 [Desulfobacteraceae bacterium]|nr:hypothetical protein [Desulfobacteraceae bacterium]
MTALIIVSAMVSLKKRQLFRNGEDMAETMVKAGTRQIEDVIDCVAVGYAVKNWRLKT